MKTELVTLHEAEMLGLTRSRLLHEGHGAFGERDDSYEQIVYVGNKVQRLSDNDLILFREESGNKEVIQVISDWNSSDVLLGLMNPDALSKRKIEKYQRYVDLKNEIESDDFYKSKIDHTDYGKNQAIHN